MTWNQIAEFTLTHDWQYTAPLPGQLFRLRHLTQGSDSRGLLSQAFLSDNLELFDTQRISPKIQHNLFVFSAPTGLADQRRIAAKLSDFSTQPWIIAIDVFETEEPINLESLLSLAMLAHESDTSAHPYYIDQVELTAAIVSHLAAVDPHPAYVDGAELTAALATKESLGAAAAAIASHLAATDPHPGYVDASELTTALAWKENRIILEATTTDANSVEIMNPQRILVSANSTLAYELYIVARRIDVTNPFEVNYWVGSGSVSRNTQPSSTVAHGGSLTRRNQIGNSSNWNVTLDADTVNGALRIRVRCDANKTVHWRVRAVFMEVS